MVERNFKMINIDKQTHEKVKKLALKEDRSMKAIIRKAINQYCNENKQ